MRTVTDAEDDLQLFWQAFPAEGGAARTTYMFSYADCAKQRPSLQVTSCLIYAVHHTLLAARLLRGRAKKHIQIRSLDVQGLLDRYFELLPGYQSCSLTDLKIKRVLFGGFPCYSSSPLQPQFDRIIQACHFSPSAVHVRQAVQCAMIAKAVHAGRRRPVPKRLRHLFVNA